MAANNAWKSANRLTGRPSTVVMASARSRRPANSVTLPIRPPYEVPNTIEKPNKTQRTPTRAAALKVIIIMLSELLTDTMPP